ncbi:membrane dipeptidase [Eubacteriales bacterium OttesenSCG-928-N13]|nr:membrane dipeptidase [Eubacteriales bacterium OttesenSCG-928-N13]
MFVADAHSDTLYSIAIEGKRPMDCAVRADRLKEGSVGLQTFALFAGSAGPSGQPYENGVRMLRAMDQLQVHMLLEDLPTDPPTEPSGVISIEGGEMLQGSIERLHAFDQMARVRMIALTWNHENEIAYPAMGGTKHALKPFGRELLREMDRLGILVDTSHLNEAGFFDAAERTALPIIASHSNSRRLCDVPRNLTREQVRCIIEKQGFIGINFYSAFLRADGKATLDDVLRHVDQICEWGGEHVLGFGSDFDGIESWPEGLGDPSRFPALIELLRNHGYTQQQLESIAGMNLWRVLNTARAARSK